MNEYLKNLLWKRRKQRERDERNEWM